jgi:hypothetical protein
MFGLMKRGNLARVHDLRASLYFSGTVMTARTDTVGKWTTCIQFATRYSSDTSRGLNITTSHCTNISPSGQTMSSSPVASGSRSKRASTPGRQPVPIMTENWDEDFEFPTLALPKGKKAETPRKQDSQAASPAEDWGEDGWDDSPPAMSRLLIANLGKRKSPTQPDIARLSLGSPRAYESVSSDLHLPRSPTSSGISGLDASSSALQLVSGQAGPSTSTTNQRSRSGSTSATVRNKLIKRHPSTSFLPIASSSSVDVSYKSKSPPGARSSYDLSRPPPAPAPPLPLPRSKSGEQMPPPPLPSFRPRSKSKSKSRPMSRQGEIRVSAIPLSPSSDQVTNVDQPRRPSFWKRLSSQPMMGEPVTAPGSCKSSVLL